MVVSIISKYIHLSIGGVFEDCSKRDLIEEHHDFTQNKVFRISQLLISPTPSASTTSSKTFSPLNILWWASIVVGARGQLTVPFPATMELSSLNGTNGFVLNGERVGDWSGRTVSSAGDVNGDGFADIVIGARYASPTNRTKAGKTYLVLGNRNIGRGGSLELASLNGTNGFVIVGESENDNSGVSVSSAGDVNGDGYADIIIGASGANPGNRTNAGKSYVVFGGLNVGENGLIDLNNLNGTNGFTVMGESANDESGVSVSSAGDMNGDGLDDILIGAWKASPSNNTEAGKSYVVFGRRHFFDNGSLELSRLDGNNGFIMNGVSERDRIGYAVSRAGDVNRDGVDDIIIGSLMRSKSYIIFGSITLFMESILALSDLIGMNGFFIRGGGRSGFSVSSAGDVNGDGIADIIIGAPEAMKKGKIKAGKSYVVFGSPNLVGNALLDLSKLNGHNGFVVNGEFGGDACGTSVSSAGDLNGDGFSDLVIGARYAKPFNKTRAGKSYVIFGSKNIGSNRSIELSRLNGANGFMLNGEDISDESGRSVSSAGDVNGDGIDDLLIGAYWAKPLGKNFAGKVYVIFGRNSSQIPQVPASSVDQTSSYHHAATTNILMSQLDTHTSSHPSSMMDITPQTSTTSSMLIQTVSKDTTPIIAGIVTAVGVLACSLFGGILYYFKTRTDPSEPEQGVSLTKQQPEQSIPTDYVAISSLLPEMQSAHMENNYDIITTKKSDGHYKAPPKEPPTSTPQEYDQINMDQENRAMEEYQIAKLEKKHENYDDISKI